MPSILRALILVVLLTANAVIASAQEPNDDAALRFVVTYDHDYSRGPLTGRVYVIATAELAGEPRTHFASGAPDTFVFSVPVNGWCAGDPVIIDEKTAGFPGRLSDLPKKKYSVQAVVDISPFEHDFATADGNGRSLSERLELDTKTSGPISLKINREISYQRREDLNRVNYRRVESRLVGRHLGKRTFIDVAVVFPQSYDPKKKDKKYPVQYWLPGFGHSVTSGVQFFQNRGIYHLHPAQRAATDEFIDVLVDSSSKFGSHFWVDSDVNGPYATAFKDEIIPAIESEFPVAQGAASRFLIGVGSGGRGALWLALRFPDLFGGIWAIAPEALTFERFLGVNLYATPAPNLYVAEDGTPRTIRLHSHGAMNEVKTVVAFESVVGTGGVLGSLEAAFGPRGENGKARPVIDRATGFVDPKIIAEWSRFDILHQFDHAWPVVGTKLEGKVHVYVGEQDDFRRADGVRAFADWCAAKKAAIDVKIVPGFDQTTIDSPAIHTNLQIEISKLHRWLLKVR